MENIEKKTPLNDLMDTTMDKIRDMVDSNTIIGEPITTPDGVTVIPVSRVSFGFGAGGGDRVLDLVPEVLDRVQNFVDKKREEKDIY